LWHGLGKNSLPKFGVKMGKKGQTVQTANKNLATKNLTEFGDKKW
jgi:hypothetical protein